MASLLRISCADCKNVCDCVALPSDTFKKSLKSEDKDTARLAKKLFKMDYVIVYCQDNQKLMAVSTKGGIPI